MSKEWRHLGITINTKEGIIDVYVDGVRYDSALASPIRFSYEEGYLRLKTAVWNRPAEDKNDNTKQ